MKLFIGCVRVGDIPAGVVTPSTEVQKCCRCNHDIYVAKSSRETMKQTGALAMCRQCVEAAGNDAFIHVPRTPEMQAEVDEIHKHLYGKN